MTMVNIFMDIIKLKHDTAIPEIQKHQAENEEENNRNGYMMTELKNVVKVIRNSKERLRRFNYVHSDQV